MSEGSALRCSFAADERGDQLAGTAAFAKGFLLIESPGAWGANALSDSTLDPDIASIVGGRATSRSYRVLLIKRPGRVKAEQRRRWALVDSSPGAEAITWGEYSSDADLLDIPFDVRASGEPASPLYLVCTHGRHDACCALRGRPVAARLAALRPALTWECSHVGGDRFAPNVLVLPHGLTYGRVQPSRAAEIVAAQERSEVVVDLLRGRAVFRPAVQAAQHFARVAGEVAAVGDLDPVGSLTTPDGEVVVDLARANGTTTVTVRPSHGESAALLTCKATQQLHPPSFTLLALDGER